MQSWRTLRRETVWSPDGGRFLTVENHTVELPDGTVIEEWPWLVTPEYANVVAQTDDGRFVCLRQTKYGAGGPTLAVPGGYLEPGEDPLPAVQRELLEETGYTAADWHPLGAYVVDGNRGAGRAHLYLARGATSVQRPDADDLEEQELLLLDRAELASALWRGEFRVLAWATAVGLALLALDARQA
jgi:8-oxo-dGTP pyrophosphatase MutT (NUDIX family)